MFCPARSVAVCTRTERLQQGITADMPTIFSFGFIKNLISFLMIKPTKCTNFSNLFFGLKLLHVLDGSILILLASCKQTCMTHTTAVCTVKNSWWWTEELSETCRVSFQNKLEILVHLVGFIIRIRHDARSHERKKNTHTFNLYIQLGDLTKSTAHWDKNGHVLRARE